MAENDKKNKKDQPEHVLADMLTLKGFSIAIVSPDVTIEELDKLFPPKETK